MREIITNLESEDEGGVPRRPQLERTQSKTWKRPDKLIRPKKPAASYNGIHRRRNKRASW